jgi:DNA-binding MarR family transcriptional regulator
MQIDSRRGCIPRLCTCCVVFAKSTRKPRSAPRVKASTMTKLVQGLEELGLISRSAAKDRRSVILRATPQGRKLLLKARGRRLDLFTGMLQGASAADLATLAKASDVIDRLLSS